MSRRQAGSNHADLFDGPGRAVERMRAFNWASTPLGPVSGWSASLKTVVKMMLRSRFAMWMAWGPDLTFFCNDAYAPTLGIKQDWAIGARSDKVWEEIWPDIGPRIAHVFETNEATWDEDLLLFLERSGYAEETYHTFSYSPLTDDDGSTRGMLCVVTEVTERVIAERRVATLRDLANSAATARSVDDACRAAMDALANNPKDIPYALIRRFDAGLDEARFVAGAGVSPDNPVIKDIIRTESQPRLMAALKARDTLLVPLTAEERKHLPSGAWQRAPEHVAIAPMLSKTEHGLSGFLACGINPHRMFDESYKDFITLVSVQISGAIANANAYEEERKRAEALTEIDRAKTAFFSNVSHEFRTPLTLMMGPLEEALRTRPDEALEMAQRNGLRLLRLVNTLLDFSRAEAGRSSANFQATDVGAYTTDLASTFRSAFQRAGVDLNVHCDPMDTLIEVDREMWEKIVLNLLSNAFKFTLEGAVTISLKRTGKDIELVVADTGVGIPADQLSKVFERFHRIEGQRGRSHEGTGIGLALVHDLVRLHGGAITVSSVEGAGTEFVVNMPARIAQAEVDEVAPNSTRARSFVEEALRWLPSTESEEPANEASSGRKTAGRIILADDNADMRSYVSRLLGDAGYEVEQVSDGTEAVEAVRRRLPDLLLSDVMMPGLTGLEVAQAIRADESTSGLPILLLSARFGEDAETEGLDSGADDYITKPFVARELVARVRSAINHARDRAAMLARAKSATSHLELVIDALPALVSYVDTDERYQFSNRAYESWFGTPKDHINGHKMSDILGGEAYEVLKPYVKKALAGEPITFDTTIPYQHGGARYVEATYLPDMDENGDVRGFFVFVHDQTERRSKDNALRESEARFREMADNAPVMIWVTDTKGSRAYLSKRWYEFTGQTEEQGLGMGWLDATHPDDKAASEAKFIAANEKQEPFSLEYRLRHADGEYRWCIDAATPRLDVDGKFLGYIGSAIDITDRKQAEDRRTLLINELNHRVKNTLAVVQSLALQGLRASPDDAAAFKTMFIKRLSALAQAHDILTHADWTGASLRELVTQALSAFATKERFSAVGPDVRLPPRAAVPLSMALHELGTNAAKYGALSNAAGRVQLDWRLETAGGSTLLDFVWVEVDGPAVAAPKRRGFGSRLIEQGLKYELDGEISLEFNPAGLRCHLRIPVDGQTSKEAA